jgi:uncharacterized tellurite resistance protein B-like protein
MSNASNTVLGRFTAALGKLFRGDSETAPPADAVPFAAATLLAEMTRVDHEVKEVDLLAARRALEQMFALPQEQAQALLNEAAKPANRPTSYHSLVSALNRNLTPEQKAHLVEHMWHVAHGDREIDMYEDHLVRKIAELLYVSHSDFISAKQRARR